jgi:hypothetical protein
LTPRTNCGRLTKVRNPDQGAKCALLASIQGPSLAAGDSNALRIGDCVWAEPILHGSALAFLALETPSDKKNANLPANPERCRLACVPPQKHPGNLAGIYGLLWHLSHESGCPDRWNSFLRQKKKPAGDSIGQTLILTPRHRLVLLTNRSGAPLFVTSIPRKFFPVNRKST